MTLLKTTTKATVAGKAAKGMVKRPAVVRSGVQAITPIAKLGLGTAKPVAKHQARQRLERIGDAARTVGETARTVGEAARTVGETAWTIGEALADYGPQVAQELGLLQAPKPKRTAPRVAVGVVIGAAAMYLLEPEHGHEHREKLRRLVS